MVMKLRRECMKKEELFCIFSVQPPLTSFHIYEKHLQYDTKYYGKRQLVGQLVRDTSSRLSSRREQHVIAFSF
jgi:hypothetical protein